MFEMFDGDTLKKLFYYCLKRTSDREQAEDLSSEITLEMLNMLNRGYQPMNFHAWMWTVARAKYSLWAKQKSRSLSASVEMYENEELKDSETSPEDMIIKNEEMNLLMRELSILSREYREITVAYYIDNMKISDISKAVALSTGVVLPEGTIKRKLYESRKYLKEGMDMIRTYGKRSYAPENIEFHVNRANTKDNVPMSLYSSKLAKNILLEAYNNPSTVEELSVALGVAAPYLEEELDKLTEGLLLRKSNDTNSKTEKYETDFVILDRETQRNIYQRTAETAEKICMMLMYCANADMKSHYMMESLSLAKTKERKTKITEKAEEKEKSILSGIDDELTEKFKTARTQYGMDVIRKWKEDYGNKTTAGTLSPDDSMWFYLFKNVRDFVIMAGMTKEINVYMTKEYKGLWNIIGFEDYPDSIFSGYTVEYNVDAVNGETHHYAFKFYIDGMSQEHLSEMESKVIYEIIKNDRRYSDLSSVEKASVEALIKRSLVSVENDMIKPVFPVIFTAGLDKLNDAYVESEYFQESKEYLTHTINASNIETQLCYDEIYRLYEYNLEQMKSQIPKHLEEQARVWAWEMLSYLSRAVYKYVRENNLLEVTDNPVGMGMYICD